jgi:hypothetical protein
MVPKKPCTLSTTDGVRHYVVFLDAVYWRPPCSPIPSTKLKGWKKTLREPATCLTCIAGLGHFIEHTAYIYDHENNVYWMYGDNGRLQRVRM